MATLNQGGCFSGVVIIGLKYPLLIVAAAPCLQIMPWPVAFEGRSALLTHATVQRSPAQRKRTLHRMPPTEMGGQGEAHIA